MNGRGKTLLVIQDDADLLGGGLRDLGLVVGEAEDTTLADIYDSDEFRGKVEVSYEYDHGDGWDHEIAFLGRADPILRKSMMIPEDIEVGHPCAEDCGGEPGWEDLKAAFKKRNDPEGKREWYKTICANGDPKGLDPFKWDILDVNDQLCEIKQ
ncbi:uncharacterized protein Z518_08911 [Rhinocladiella mackenziei CBS 650.93]|uniref:Plasmid pRiA4b Orf3-like domain-containing protein n=1 Tax=Rhinocladiella mackenziei CBS 650.93 TaxID=1442369 RepID=A0A0D2ID82_9EURO|nr:uncharacterized protein Z518_08911 [Rhinocladiella mackenziei CBS 650.93]KIX01186.1 hypothetical protein Z518_08911 [Rhinocladiella mackenziei CBS 650.93]